MSEAFPHATGDQQLQPAVPAERVQMAPGMEYSIDIAGDSPSLYDPASVDLAPAGNGTSFKVMGALELGSAGPQADESASVFVVEITHSLGAKEVGLMGTRRDEQGNLVAARSWQTLPRSFPTDSWGSEVTLGRRAKGEDSTEGFTGKIDIASLFPGQPDKDFGTVSRKHLALRLEGLGDDRKLVVRDLDSANGTVLTRAETTAAETTEQTERERSPAASSRLIGSLATPQLIDKIPDFGQSEAAPEKPALTTEERQLIESKIQGIDTMIAADPRLVEVQKAKQRLAGIIEDKRQNWAEARKPGSDQQVFGQNSRRIQEWEADARKQLAQLPETSRGQYDSLVTEQNRLRDELNPPK